MTHEETIRTTPSRPSPDSGTPTGSQPAADTAPEHTQERGDDQPVRYEGVGIAAGFIALVVAAAAVLVVVGQNVERVPFEFLWWGADVPLAVLLLATALIVLIVGELVGLVWRKRRRQVRQLVARS